MRSFSRLGKAGRGAQRYAIAILVAILGSSYPLAGWAQGRATITGPSSVQGDGTTPTSIRIHIDGVPPPSATRMRLAASAGSMGALRDLSLGQYEVDYVPPHVAEPITAELQVVVAGLSLQGEPLRLPVVPPTRSITYRATRGPLDLIVPAKLSHGLDAGAELSLAAEGGPDPQLWVSAGAAHALQPKQGRLVAGYDLPSERFPQHVIVVALGADGSGLDWTSFPIHGRPRIATTTVPQAMVRAQVAGVAYGPVRASTKGEAHLRVEVPPGIRSGTAIATDRYGRTWEKPLSIGAPPAARTFAVCLPTRDRVLVFALDEHGQPREALTLGLESSAGTLAAPTRLAPGVYDARYAPPADLAASLDVTVRARIAGEPGSETSCVLSIQHLPPRLEATAAHPKLVADGTSSTTITVRLFDVRGKPASSARWAVQARGDIGSWSTTAPGTHTATYTAPRSDQPLRDTIIIRDELSGAQASLGIDLGPPPLPPQAPPQPPWLRASLRAGALMNFQGLVGPLVLGGFGGRLPLWDRNLSLQVEAGISGASTTQSDAAGEEVEIDVLSVPLLGRLAYELPVDIVRIYAGVDVGAFVTWSEVSSTTTGERGQTDGVFAIGGALGVDIATGPGRVLIEAGYTYAALDNEQVAGHVGGLNATAGYRFEFLDQTAPAPPESDGTESSARRSLR